MRQTADKIDPAFTQQWTYHKNEQGVNHDGSINYYTGRLWVRPKEKTNLSPKESNIVMNRGLRDRDTFVTMFPNYRIHGETYESAMKSSFYYRKNNTEGANAHEIDRTHTRKMDMLKKYTEEMLKIQSIQRKTNAKDHK